MTWKEFKTRAEELGVVDDMDMVYIDIHLPLDIEVEFDDLGFFITDN
jgi:hypothetical protein